MNNIPQETRERSRALTRETQPTPPPAREAIVFDNSPPVPKMVTTNQPIRARYLGHVTGYQPIKDQYFLELTC